MHSLYFDLVVIFWIKYNSAGASLYLIQNITTRPKYNLCNVLFTIKCFPNIIKYFLASLNMFRWVGFINSLDTELVRTYFLNIPSVNTTIDEPHKPRLKKISHLQVVQPSIYLCMDHSDSSSYTICAIKVQHITYKYGLMCFYCLLSST